MDGFLSLFINLQHILHGLITLDCPYMVREAPVAMFVICKLILSGNGDIYVDFCVQREIRVYCLGNFYHVSLL